MCVLSAAVRIHVIKRPRALLFHIAWTGLFLPERRRIYICGDFNSRVGGCLRVYWRSWWRYTRDVIDHTSNVNGDLFIDFLVDSGMCMVNGRLGQNDFTHVSHRGKSVVDYVCVPYEQLHFVSDFQVHLMSDVVGALNCPVYKNSRPLRAYVDRCLLYKETWSAEK